MQMNGLGDHRWFSHSTLPIVVGVDVGVVGAIASADALAAVVHGGVVAAAAGVSDLVKSPSDDDPHQHTLSLQYLADDHDAYRQTTPILQTQANGTLLPDHTVGPEDEEDLIVKTGDHGVYSSVHPLAKQDEATDVNYLLQVQVHMRSVHSI